MRFTSQKAVLSEAVGVASRAVSSKNAIPALEGILIECREDGLTLTSYNLEIGIVTHCGAEVEETGRTVVTARLISDIIHKLPDEDVIFQTESDSVCRIQCGPVEYSIPLIDPAEFPDLPEIEGNTSFSISQSVLKNMIDKTIFAIAQTDIKPILTGLYFDVKKGVLNIVAIDNYRMALR
ncbi:MAG: DNA polymerase III subunit beta, partial [Clostridia bacterium]|nr:DNA polymerase III subunit beta [Clostridia bacterium]